MKPLQPIALGLVIIALVAPLGGYDVFADPVGWLLVLAGVLRAPVADARRRTLQLLALVAGAVSLVLWFPRIGERLAEADPALVWAANLPQLGFTALLCLALAETAREPDPAAGRWLRTTMLLVLVVGVLPVLAFGAGVTALEQVTYVGAALTLLLLISLVLIYSGRPWAVVERRPAD